MKILSVWTGQEKTETTKRYGIELFPNNEFWKTGVFFEKRVKNKDNV